MASGEPKVFSAAYVKRCSSLPSAAPPTKKARKTAYNLHAGVIPTWKNVQERCGGCVVIPEDLLLEILVHLPAKSVGRFRCVSKCWLSSTMSAKFIQVHASFARISGFIPHPVNYTCHIPIDSASHIDRLSDPSFPLREKVDGGPPFSYNGLLLHHGLGKDKNTKTFYICNPMTKQLLVIPRSMLGCVFGHALALDPLRPSRFKIAVWEWEPRSLHEKCRLHVYSSTTQEWKVLYEVGFTNWEWQRRQAVHWNGSLVWPSERGSFLLLDVEKERVKKVGLPNLPCRYLGESRGRLYFIGTKANSVDHVDIFEMESESTGWSVLYQLDLKWYSKGLSEDVSKINAHIRKFCPWILQERRRRAAFAVERSKFTVGIRRKGYIFSSPFQGVLNGHQQTPCRNFARPNSARPHFASFVSFGLGVGHML